jgi:hypothetical protein
MVALSVGDVVAIKCWWGEHWGIAAIRDGLWTLISNRGIKGLVTEEPLADVAGNSQCRIVERADPSLASVVVARARAKIGTRYDFWQWNCQDLVYWAFGQSPQSPQRDALVGVLSIAGLAILVGGMAKSG